MAYIPDDRFYEALRRLKEGGRFEELTTEDIATCENINRKILDLSRQQTADTNAFQAVIAGNSMLYCKLNAYRSMPEVQEQEEVITREYELLLYDTLVPNLLLKELCYAQ